MKKTTLIISGILASFILGFYINSCIAKEPEGTINSKVYMNTENTPMKLGVFSVSLNVKDLKTSREFYEKLGFTLLGGAMESNYVIMKNENAIIGLFQGMFEGHILTFNPGWDESAHNIDKFDDVRVIQKVLKSRGIKTDSEADEKTTGPASVILKDPDGNVIFIDQHR
jgi:catechol 2,3-dioxygenase-like lactoylglutathione lyase family enzyme